MLECGWGTGGRPGWPRSRVTRRYVSLLPVSTAAGGPFLSGLLARGNPGPASDIVFLPVRPEGAEQVGWRRA